MFCRTKQWLPAFAWLLCSGAAWAGESAEQGAVDFGAPVTQEALGEWRAGESGGFEISVETITQRTTAVMFDTEAKHNRTGSNTVSDGSFAGASGLAVNYQNTGNNVIMQNAVILHIDMR